MLFTISLILFLVCWLICVTVTIAGMWGSFSRAGRPGWACIVPIYNYLVIIDIAGKPWWWIFMFMIPIANLYFVIVTIVNFTASYGRGVGFAIGLIFLPFIFWPLLGFGDSEHQGAY